LIVAIALALADALDAVARALIRASASDSAMTAADRAVIRARDAGVWIIFIGVMTIRCIMR